MKEKKAQNKGNYYNLEAITSIPIEEVCRSLGFNIQHKGSRIWAKLRNEEDASALLHPENNTFYDFGTQDFGGVIDLVAVTQGYDKKEAIEFLANMFGIEPVNPRNKFNNNELTLHEYALIGIYGDMVSKNLNFDPDFNFKQMAELADKYSISMNELRRKKEPEYKAIYEAILRDKSLYMIKQMRNSYFMDIWSEYAFLKSLNALEMFDTVCNKSKFQELYKDIIVSEKIFNRAIEGTSIKKIPKRDYSPNKILEEIIEHKLKPEFGRYNYKEMQDLAKAENCYIKYRVVDYLKYMSLKENMSTIPYSAFLDSGNVIVGFLEKDKEQINELYGPPESKDQKNKNSFNSIVANAENRRNNTVSNQSKETIEK